MRANVYIRNYKTKKGEKRYYLVVREYGHQSRMINLGPVSKNVAEERRISVLSELLNGTYQRVSDTRLLFGEFCEKRFLAEYAPGQLSPETIALYEDKLTQIKKYFGTYRLDQIRREDIELLLNGKKSWGPRSKNIALSILRHVFQKAVDWRYLALSPVQGIKRWRETPVGSLSLTESQIGTLLDLASPWQLQVITVLTLTGMRPGELSRLKFCDINWESHKLTIVSDKDRKTKSRKRREIDMKDDLEVTLRFLQKNWPNPQYVSGGDSPSYFPRTEKQMDYVFCHQNGKSIRKFGRSMSKLFKKAQIEGVSLHGFRKTFCSLLARRGVHIKVAQELMGHADARLTLDVYTQTQDDQRRAAIESLPSLRELQQKRNPELKKERELTPVWEDCGKIGNESEFPDFNFEETDLRKYENHSTFN